MSWRGPAGAVWLPLADVAPWLATGIAETAPAAAAPAPEASCRAGFARAAQPPASNAATARMVTRRAAARSRCRAVAGGQSLTVDRMPHHWPGPISNGHNLAAPPARLGRPVAACWLEARPGTAPPGGHQDGGRDSLARGRR